MQLPMRRGTRAGLDERFVSGQTVYYCHSAYCSSNRERDTVAFNDEATQPLSPVVFQILVALADGEKHGYAIMKEAEATSGLAMGPGTIYGSIQRMEDAGLVRESDEPSKGRRKLYAVTDAGRLALRAEALRIAGLAELLNDREIVPVPGRS